MLDRPGNLIASALTKKYGNFIAVDSLDLQLRPGEVYGFLGPNGSGKSTTIKMLTGILSPTSGNVTICGYDLKKEPEKAKAALGYVSDEPPLYEKLTGLEFLDFVGDLYGVPRKVRKTRSSETLALLGMEDKGKEHIQSYSKGMRQKVAIAAALIHEPRVLIMDEPVTGLDPMSARILKSVVRRLARSGATVLMSTHLLEIAERMCDRVGILVEGKIVAEGTMDNLREKTGDVAGGLSLEDVFISLAAGDEYKEVIASLDREADSKVQE